MSSRKDLAKPEDLATAIVDDARDKTKKVITDVSNSATGCVDLAADCAKLAIKVVAAVDGNVVENVANATEGVVDAIKDATDTATGLVTNVAESVAAPLGKVGSLVDEITSPDSIVAASADAVGSTVAGIYKGLAGFF